MADVNPAEPVKSLLLGVKLNLGFPITCWEAHNVEDAVQLVVVVRVTGLYVLLPAVEYRLRGQELCKDAADRPDVLKKKKKIRVIGNMRWE